MISLKILGDGKLCQSLDKGNLKGQAKRFFKNLDPNPSIKEIREAQCKGKQVSESLWRKILKLPTSDQNNWISMNNSLLQNISPFPNTSIVQTPYHAWRKI